MSIHLILPGLVWPDAGNASIVRDLPLPALTQLLRHARIAREPGCSPESWLARLFGCNVPDIPFAALRRLGENEASETGGYWLCADPVHLYFAQEHLLLSDAADLEITKDEADTLIASLNDFFCREENDFIRFEACTPTRWYLNLNTPAGAAGFPPLHDAIGRPIAHFMPEGEQARRWRRIANEIQMLLHDHPVNTAREQAGHPPINSVWFWGQGNDFEALRASAPFCAILADDTFTRGLALAAGITPETPDHLPQRNSLIVLNETRHAAVHLDEKSWRKALLDLESQWFAPLLAALKTQHYTTLRISAPGDRCTLTLEIRARDLWKFWQRAGTLDDLITASTNHPDHSQAVNVSRGGFIRRKNPRQPDRH